MSQGTAVSPTATVSQAAPLPEGITAPHPRCWTLAADHCYWAVLPDDPGRGTARAYRMEAVLPVAVDTIQIADQRLADGRVVMVGVETESLRRLLDDARAAGHLGPWRLTPDGLPADWDTEDHLALRAVPRLNLLTGPFEVKARRRWRRALVCWWVLAVGIGLGVIAVGIEQRAHNHHQAGDTLRRQLNARLDQLLPATEHGDLPPEMRLTQALRRLHRDHQQQTDPVYEQAISALLDALAARWPRGPRVQIQALTVTSQRVVLRGRSGLSPQAVAEALDGLENGRHRYRSSITSSERHGEDFLFVITLLPGPIRSADPGTEKGDA